MELANRISWTVLCEGLTETESKVNGEKEEAKNTRGNIPL
jgi:hypothetical protein